MTLHVLVGRSGSGKTYEMLEEVREHLLTKPMGDPIVYLVPDQMTFQIEYDLITTPGIIGMLRAQVFSFSRLAWRVLQETGGISRYHLDNVGTSMLLRKIIEHRKNEFLVFKKAANQSGFIDQIESMIKECKRYCVTSDSIKQQLQNLDGNINDITLTHKLHDFSIIYEEFERQLLHQYVDSEDYLRLLSEKIPYSTYLKQATIYIDGFHSFTPQEFEVLQQLMKVSKEVKIALTLEKPLSYQPHELHLFHMTGKTYLQLVTLAEATGTKMNIHSLTQNRRGSENKALSHLESHFESRPTVPSNDSSTVKLRAAGNRRVEVEAAAKEIIRLVREESYRYRDMAIILRNTSLYHDLLETVFQEYEIPIFIDEKRSMLHHPLIEFIRSAMEVITGNWRYESVFRLVKTDILFPVGTDEAQLREEFDQLENYVLAYGIQSKKWRDAGKWSYYRFVGIDDQGLAKTSAEVEKEEKINELKDMITTPLLQFEKNLKTAHTGRGFAEALYHLLEQLQVPEKLESWRNEAEKSGDVSRSREHDQVWNAVIDLLDQFVELMGEEPLSLSLFQSMMEAGMESLRFALVPPAIDQVLVGDFEHSRFSHIKASFILGVTDGVIPAVPSDEGILNEDERDVLSKTGVSLAPGSKQQLLDEQFLLYMAVCLPSKQLWLSYPLANEEGKSLVPSIFIKRIKDIFPTLKEQLVLQDPEGLPIDEQLEYVTNPLKTISYLATQMQQWTRHYPIAPLWWDVYNTLQEKKEWMHLRSRVLSSLFYINSEKPLTTNLTEELYGKEMTASVSRMELFQGCSFAHFSSYGLKLQERQIYRLEAPDIGQFFHAALKMIADRIQEYNLTWGELTKKQCEDMAHEIVEVLAPRIQKEILLSSNRYHYLKRKLTQVIGRASIILSEHAKASGFTPVGLELGFGRNGQLPSLRFNLKNDVNMELIGRIDRVDAAKGRNGTYLRIVDYKSSQKSMNLSEVYYGLSLQMLTYLDIVLSNAKAWIGDVAIPAGVLYFHVHNPIIKAKAELDMEDIEEELLKSFKMKGLLLGDEEAVRLMDTTLDSGHSKIISAGLKKTGGFYDYSAVASEEEFNTLRKHVRKTFEQIGNTMLDGKVDINPYQLKGKTPCTYCSFKAFCQFDESLSENSFRLLEASDDQSILKKIQTEVKEHETLYSS
ncbi:helicase-exonuclease AddAB subunit AddB [Bacillus salitolerans]|uniref:ATP-dependent helicase/deoxyribonuclease subunit B n=1 Tax=Bacillus salitolerans TaxID=1437434 RepID=A0ABW4LJL7_9BACI